MTTTKNYIIPLRKSFQQAAPLKRTPKALRAVKDYLMKHCKVEDVKLGKHLNEYIWAKGITNPPHKVSVVVLIDATTAKAELEGFTYEEAKKIVKKQEAQSFKEKMQEKLAATKDKTKKSDEKKEEKPAPKKAKVAPSPVTTEQEE
jgi:large subunit ribosomal protein L31e